MLVGEWVCRGRRVDEWEEEVTLCCYWAMMNISKSVNPMNWP